ncbi:LytTR family transcriptional regulator [Phenylobacterium sp. J426]|uniref:LytTR family DNA-binding domain-containing protein n=1 Tax=Phenylobacterium sp. J426 TaxID=2898439 RepID=UPI00215157E1|nr:LytTR family DNA-binding domain-containing protein [Phenylobacterium sp. J426]MCR5876188.1 LytTR family transcriptional regulator [Phenylobacterium sp. J426]
MSVLEVRDGAKRVFLPLAEVTFVEAAGNYVELHRAGEAVLHRAALADLEQELADVGFVRIHRSRLVRRDAIAQVESKSSGDFTVRLADGRELAGSRRYRRPLLKP